ncbi:hypothetical protein DOMOVOI_00120 [Brevundimonas phage vB_BpoS-Domovoi]|uniref:Uncharacterized protein n=1 Tax=Brevundimonas phage vB_BpoS-Domovoi TaxID=2948598 RepID=A0A9E7SM57_9CAUD|nr:hypothetical protein DOMOVOI_00120 [Brevundimonas phage vB_BpoS-Domovoi]
MQHPIRPERQEFVVMFWMGDDMGVYKRTVRAQSHPEACYRAVSRANDGAVNSVVRKKAFRAVTMAAMDDVDSFEGPLDGSALLEGRVEGYKPAAKKAAA